jgi:glycosidase
MSHAINIYQIFTRLFRNDTGQNKKFGSISDNGVSKFNDFNDTSLKAIHELGVTHVWYTGIIRHATCSSYKQYGIDDSTPSIVKGRAGSPYAITDYYDVDPDLSVDVSKRMSEFENLVKRTHKNKLKVIIDFVPNHVAREYKSICKPRSVKDLGEKDDILKQFDSHNNFYYLPYLTFEQPDGISFPYTKDSKVYKEYPAKATGNDSFYQKPSTNDWYETVKLNYGIDIQNNRTAHFDPIPDTWFKMRDILLFWAKKNVDAFRCDMAEMVPVEFWEWAITEVKQLHPHIVFIAEVYNPNEYNNYLHRGGFDYLYDKVGLYDVVRAITQEECSAAEIANYWKSRDNTINHTMVRFMENHDEQRIASPQFAGDAFAGVPGMVLSGTMHSCPLMIYFGQEIGETATDDEGFSGKDGRTTIFDYWNVKAYQKWVNKGTFDDTLLSTKQKELRSIYQKLFQARNEFEALKVGGFYDISYANYNSDINLDKIFAYVRHSAKQKLLIIVNFDKMNGYCLKLKLPEHLLEYIGMPIHATYSSIDYFEGIMSICFTGISAIKEGINMEIKPKSALLFDITDYI